MKSDGTITREELVQSQARVVIKIIHDHKDNLKAMQRALINISALNEERPNKEEASLKPDAIELVINEYARTAQRSPSDDETIKDETIKALTTVLDRIRIGVVKEYASLEEKQLSLIPQGDIADQKLFKKEKKASSPFKERKMVVEKGMNAEGVCEYIGSQLANVFLPHLSPKFRLYQLNTEGEEPDIITMNSTFMEAFKPIRDHNHSEMLAAENFGYFFAVNALLGDYDLHNDNVGLIDGKLARIDFGKALSYYFDGAWSGALRTLTEPKTAKQFQSRLQEIGENRFSGLAAKMYPDEMFQGVDFIIGVYQATQQIDDDRIRAVIKHAVDNLQIALETTFLRDAGLNGELRKRLGIKELHQDMTTALVQEKIIKNINILKPQLVEIAKQEAIDTLKESPDGSELLPLYQAMPKVMKDIFTQAVDESNNHIIKLFIKNNLLVGEITEPIIPLVAEVLTDLIKDDRGLSNPTPEGIDKIRAIWSNVPQEHQQPIYNAATNIHKDPRKDTHKEPRTPLRTISPPTLIKLNKVKTTFATLVDKEDAGRKKPTIPIINTSPYKYKSHTKRVSHRKTSSPENIAPGI